VAGFVFDVFAGTAIVSVSATLERLWHFASRELLGAGEIEQKVSSTKVQADRSGDICEEGPNLCFLLRKPIDFQRLVSNYFVIRTHCQVSSGSGPTSWLVGIGTPSGTLRYVSLDRG